MTSNKKIHFEISERKILLKIFDQLAVLLTLYLVSLVFNFDYFRISLTHYSWFIVLALYLHVFGNVFEMYNLQVASNYYQIIKSIILTTSTTVLVYILTPFYTPFLPTNRLQIILFYIAILTSLLLWRFFYVAFMASHRFVKQSIIVCDNDQLQDILLELQKADPHYRFIAHVSSDGLKPTVQFRNVSSIALNDLEHFVRQNSISEIVIATQNTNNITADLYSQLLKLLENGFIIREYTQLYENITQRIPVHYVSKDFYRYFPFSRNNHNRLYLLVVRVLEVILSLVGLGITCIIIPFILLCNLFANKGKLFYTQERVGQNGVPFKIYKFRTMVKNAEAHGAVFASTNDVRVTPFGKFLRRTRIDEFPQFINILKGDMAIIGPRPERPVFVEEIAKVMPFYETRHVVKPGLTGWAQVNYSYGDSISDSLMKLQYDLYYIKHRSLYLDINIIIKTISTVVFYRGQ